MVDGAAGKGDSYRPVDQAKWDAAWARLQKRKEKNVPRKLRRAKKRH